MEVQINAERFYLRLRRLIKHWVSEKMTMWGGSDALCIYRGSRGDDDDTTNYTKSAAIQLYLLGYEIPDSIIVITKNAFWFMATEKKCKLLESSLGAGGEGISFNVLQRTKDEGLNRERYNALLGVIRKGGGSKVGSLFKEKFSGDFIGAWMNSVDLSQIEKIDIAAPLGHFLSIKEADELVSYPLSKEKK